MKKKILEKGIDSSKFFMLENWVDTNFIKPVSKKKSLKKLLGFVDEDRIVLYSGNLGEKQGLEILIDVAEKLSRYNHIKIVLCGEGALKPRLQEKMKEMNIENVHFLSLQPYEKLSEFLSIADLHLVLQKKVASDLVMPSKLTTILGVGGVAIVSAMPNTNLFEVISNNEIGIIIDPENPMALFESIIENIDNDNFRIKSNARLYAESNLNRDSILRRFNDLILKMCT
jgi:colanic acid biosynthesis glycosyl transferase WcaI